MSDEKTQTEAAAPTEDSDAHTASVELRNELMHTDQYSEYLLHQPREILSVLKKVAEAGDLITIYFNEGKDFLLTTLLSANENGLTLDKGSSAIMNDRAIQSDKLFCVTRNAKVKLQFLLTGLREDNSGSHPIFAAALPATLLRLQRRENFRLSTPITRPLICYLPFQHADGSIERVGVNIVDISAGGIAMLAPPDNLPLEADMEFENCTMELPEMGVLTTNLRVCNIYEITLRNGHQVKRSGCQFINLPPTGQNLVQRYIIKIERERKARESGLA